MLDNSSRFPRGSRRYRVATGLQPITTVRECGREFQSHNLARSQDGSRSSALQTSFAPVSRLQNSLLLERFGWTSRADRCDHASCAEGCGEVVGKMRTICGRDSRKGRRTANLDGFSEDSQENPPESAAAKRKHAFASQAFPPIHRPYHNNKTLFQKKRL